LESLEINNEYEQYWFSPDLQYAAILSTEGWNLSSTSLGDVKILDLPTGDVIAEIPDVGPTDYEDIYWREVITWSPDSAALAFIRNADGEHGQDIWIYNLAEQQPIRITNDSSFKRGVAWSLDSQQIAYATSDDSDRAIVVHSINGSSSLRVVMEDVEGNSANISWLICNLIWSDNQKFIAFEDQCHVFGPKITKEIYLLSIEEQKIIRLTDLQDAMSITTLDYDMEWAENSEALLIAYSKLPFGPPDANQTTRIGLLRVDLTDFSVAEVAFLEDIPAYNIDLSPDGAFLAWESRVWPLPTEISIAKIDNGQIIVTAQAEDSCGPLQWSTDGAFILYTRDLDADCIRERGEAIFLLDPDTGDAAEVLRDTKGQKRTVDWSSQSLP
jgi:WD40 repeat protein